MSGFPFDRDRFWRLLPEIYRRRDIETDGPMRALLEAWSEQAGLLQADIARQYDNWFLETCEDWVVPYIGDVIGCRPVHGAGGSGLDEERGAAALARSLAPRREVGNTMRYRRRKGTLPLLEQVVRDVAGWPALAMESREHILITPHMRLPRQDWPGTAGNKQPPDLLGSPADAVPRTVEVRRISSTASTGRHGATQVAVYVSCYDAVPVTKSEAVCASGAGPHCFFLSALGQDAPLYRREDREARRLPGPIARSALADPEDRARLYGEGRSLMIWTQPARGEALHPLPAEKIVPAKLAHWSERPAPDHVALDPERGRLMFPEGEAPIRVVASLYEGAFGMVGASERPRRLPPEGTRQVYKVGDGHHRSLRAAIEAWRHAQPAAGLIVFTDSASYEEEDLSLDLQAGQSLEIRAATRTRPLIRLAGRDASRFDAWRLSGTPDSSLVLDGLLLTGDGLLVEGGFGALTLRHCTVLPGDGAEAARLRPASLRVEGMMQALSIERSILTRIHVRSDERRDEPLAFRIDDSIVDGGAEDAIDGGGAPAYVALDIRRSTVLGRCALHRIDLAEDTIFTRRVIAARRQAGHMRFCFVPEASRTPRRFECLPAADDPAVGPVFVSITPSEPGYCQLAPETPRAIMRGASDQSELGVFHDLFVPQRQTHLRAVLEEYTPTGIDVGVIYVI